MLRINLLPPYINERGQKRNLFIGWIIGIVVIIAAFLVVFSNLNTTLGQKKDELAHATDLLNQKNGLDKQIADEKGRRAAIEAKQTFVANAKKYNEAWPEVYEMMRDVTTPNILLRSMALDTAQRKTVNLTGFARNEAEVVRWWMELRNRTALFDQVSFSLPPKPFQPDKGAATGGGIAGMPGMSMPGSGGKMGIPTASGMGASGPSSGGGMGKMGGFGGGFGGDGGGNNAGGIGPIDIEGRTGLSFAAAAVLKTALAGGLPTPVWTGGGAPAGGAAGGAQGGVPNSMGAMSGMGGGPAMRGGPGGSAGGTAKSD